MKKNHIILIVLGTLLALLFGYLIWRFPHVMESEDHFGHFFYSILLLCLLVPSFFLHREFPHALKSAAAWVGIFLVLFVGYSYHEDLGSVWERLKSNLLPFAGTQHSDGSITFTRAEGGHFYVEALVNGTPIHFMVDTGATRIALTQEDAKRAGFDVDNLPYSELIHTANGDTMAAPVYLNEFKIGPIVMTDLSASVNKNLSTHSLLGMNFLKKLKGFKIEGNRLTFEIPQS
ncbi:MAG: TIGR02281 family clan AA aspartic protease [Alphaproteobacteria bacterium]|jgi:aspartyl protease family protein|nr:TIGR02281 family clan AA aspartic protease [Alphaproteobacteria bacterium]